MNRAASTLLLAGIFFTLILSSCGGGDNGSDGDGPSDELKAAEGGRYYGGVFNMNEVEFYRSLFPQSVTEVTGHRITNQVYEGLVTLDQKTLEVKPLIAERWEVDSTATRFTFYLRKDVVFHNDPSFEGGKGRAVTAKDFAYCFKLLCTPGASNQGFWVFEDRVKGASNYYNSLDYLASKESLAKYKANGDAENVAKLEGKLAELEAELGDLINNPPSEVEGIIIEDDHTITIELEQPFASFMHVLAMPFTAVFPQEAFEEYGLEMRDKPVGTGPYVVRTVKDNEVIILVRNEAYWGKDEFGNQLPLLDAIKVSFIKERKSELIEFSKGGLDMIYRLPLEMIEDVVTRDDELKPDYSQFTLQVMANMAVQYYGFQHWDSLFVNKDLRIAFNYAVDREKIVDFTLKGTGIAGGYGIVPPGMPGYDSKAIKGYSYNPEKAREYMAKAGYPNGEGFPEVTLQLNSGGGTNEQVAEAVQKMLQETLNIKVNIMKMQWAQHLENLETGKAQFWRAGWIADYPDPQNFLNLFYSPVIPATIEERSYLNSTRYKSEEFDAFYEQALRTVDSDQRNLLYMKADQVMIDDAAIIPIYYYKDHRLLQPYVRSFPQNGMEYRNFRETYFVPLAN